jgi:hypothetical protein
MPLVGWTMLYLFVFLKLPIVAACWLIWWAIHQEPDYEEGTDGGGGRPRPHPAPTLPHAPRRGPHHEPAPAPPARVRVAGGTGRLPARDHLRPL